MLSEKCAMAVKAYLVKQGNDTGRLETKGYGSSDPIASKLQKPEMEGKVITMEGDLYIGNGMFHVTRTWKGKK